VFENSVYAATPVVAVVVGETLVLEGGDHLVLCYGIGVGFVDIARRESCVVKLAVGGVDAHIGSWVIALDGVGVATGGHAIERETDDWQNEDEVASVAAVGEEGAESDEMLQVGTVQN
jgi:hypothetical protein